MLSPLLKSRLVVPGNTLPVYTSGTMFVVTRTRIDTVFAGTVIAFDEACEDICESMPLSLRK